MKKRILCLRVLLLACAGLTIAGGAPVSRKIDFRPYLANQPWLQQIGMPDTLALPESDLIVAVVDIDIDVSHPCLKDKIIPSDFRAKEAIFPEKIAGFGHGTAVASIIVAESPDMIGIAPNIRILPVCLGLPNPEGFEDIATSYFKLTPAEFIKMLKDPEQKKIFMEFGKARNVILHENVGAAIKYAADHGAGLINLSLVTFEHPAVKEAVEYASARGAVLIAGSGNGAKSPVTHPAMYSDTIAVGGVNEKDEWWFTEQKLSLIHI